MPPHLSEDEIDDLIYFARAGETADIEESLSALATRENVAAAEILSAARDGGKSSCLHMAAGNGHLGMPFILNRRDFIDCGLYLEHQGPMRLYFICDFYLLTTVQKSSRSSSNTLTLGQKKTNKPS